MPDVKRIIVTQTAFPGDVILTLPLIQALKKLYPSTEIDMMVIPRAAQLLTNHPDITNVIVYDKRGKDKGIGGMFGKAKELRMREYDLAFIPHRSMRSAVVNYFAKIPSRIGFSTSAGSFLFSQRIPYQSNHHEYRRNLDLLAGIGKEWKDIEYPRLYPSAKDQTSITGIVASWGKESAPLIAIAPGTVWKTKQWLPERFADLAGRLGMDGFLVALIGGPEDAKLCEDIRSLKSDSVRSFAGKLSMLESAEMIRRSSLLISNDSAPVHLAVAMGTRVIAIFGATVPEFGFAPYGIRDSVIETKNLPCRPCSIHGGNACPIKTFVCMNDISVDTVLRKVNEVMKG